jgi:hypothetical protein
MTIFDLTIAFVFFLIVVAIIMFSKKEKIIERENFENNIIIGKESPLENTFVAKPLIFDTNPDQSDSTSPNVKCANKSLNELHETGKNMLQKNGVCGQMDGEYDMTSYYKNLYKINAIIDDNFYLGYNQENDKESPEKIGNISLEKTNDNPMAHGYAF